MSETTAAPPLVTVVVLNWNNYSATHDCVQALVGNLYPNLKLMIVDNGSGDGSADRLAKDFPAIPLIRNQENLGFSRGCNVGIQAALIDLECAHVLLVNNDCVVARDAITFAVNAASDRSIGVVTGKVVDDQGRIWHAGGTISLLRGQSTTRGFREKDVGQFEEPCDTEWASGAMMLIRRDVLDSVGGLPEEYFFGVEEWDYSLRVLRAGYRIRYEPRFTGVHPGGGSHDNHDPKFAYNYYRNKLIFQERYLSTPAFQMWLLAFRAYLYFRMRRHIRNLAKITYADPSSSPVDEVVYAAWSALRDHGKNQLSEATMLAFDDELRSRRAAQEGARRG